MQRTDWIEIGDKYWLTPGLDLIFDLFDSESYVNLHHPNAKSLQSIKFYDNICVENHEQLINISNSKYYNNPYLKNIVNFELEMLFTDNIQ